MIKMNELINKKLLELKRSKFRSSFHLNNSMKEYVKEKGFEVIKEHAYDFINTRLKPCEPEKDGRQTPMKGHPVFIAQHACACCCRGCLEKWHHIPKGRELTKNEVNYIVYLLIIWIKNEFN